MLLDRPRLPDPITAERRIGRRDRRVERRGDRRRRRVVVVTGGGGYIGSVLVRRLLDRGHIVRVIERFLYGDGALRDLLPHPLLSLTLADFRRPQGLDRAFAGADSVVHLGAVSGEAACALDEGFALGTNVAATDLIAARCRALGVPRLVFASTCGVYGANAGVLDESAEPRPVSLYARSKLAAERSLLDHPDRRTAPVVLRLADAYGVSYRPRFDLPVNALIAGAGSGRRVAIDDEQRAPFLHVDDIARALVAVIEAPLDRVARQVFNVGPDGAQDQRRELNAQIGALLPGVAGQFAEVADSPRICGDKLRAAVGFQPIRSVAEGVAGLASALSGSLLRWQDARFDNRASLAHLIATQPGMLAAEERGRLLFAVSGRPLPAAFSPLPAACGRHPSP